MIWNSIKKGVKVSSCDVKHTVDVVWEDVIVVLALCGWPPVRNASEPAAWPSWSPSERTAGCSGASSDGNADQQVDRCLQTLRQLCGGFAGGAEAHNGR